MKYLISILFLIISIDIFSQPVHQYLFEHTGTVAIDSMGNKNATLIDAATTTSEKYQSTRGVSFNVTNHNRMEISGFDFGSGSVAISMWIKNSTTSSYPIILSNRQGDAVGGIRVFLDDPNRRVFIRSRDTDLVEADAFSNTGVYSYGTWFHLLLNCKDVDEANWKIWVNGVNVTADSVLQIGWPTTGTLSFGAEYFANTNWGYMDNIQIYDRYLSATQIDSLYDNGTTGFYLSFGIPPVTYSDTVETYKDGIKRFTFKNAIRKLFKPNIFNTYGPYEPGYYFSSIHGNDGNDGLSPLTPKQSEAAMKLLFPNLTPGDKVFFERGSEWDEIDINLTQSGTITDSIILTNYGTGALPIFTGLATLTSFSQEGNVWTKSDSRIKNTKENYLDLYTGGWQQYRRKTGFLGSIFINGTAYGLSRYPDSTPLSFETVDATGYTYVTDASSSFPSTNSLVGAQLKIMQGHWSAPYTTITWNNATTLSLTPGDFNVVFGEIDNGAKGMIFNSNHSTVLNQNGEFYHNTSGQSISIYWDNNINSSVVKVPVVDSIFSLTNVSYVKLDGLELKGSRVNGAKIHGGGNNVISNCKISYCLFNAIHQAGTSNNTIKGNNLFNSDNGVFSAYSGGTRIYDNYIHRMGEDVAYGDIEGYSGNGIVWETMSTASYIERNWIDSTNYCGIHIHENTGDASPGLLIKNNYIDNWCRVKSDGGAIYLVSNDDNADKKIRGNIVKRNGYVSDWVYTADPIYNNIYMDNNQCYTLIDSNTVYGVGMFNHYGSNYMTFTNNKVFINNYNNYANIGMHSEANNGYSGNRSYYVTFTRNEVVSTSNSTGFFTHIGNPGITDFTTECGTFTMDYNKYFSYNSGQNFFRFSPYWASWQYYTTLSAWRTFTGKETLSDLKFNSTFSSTEAIMYMNYSGSSHTFNLGTAAFRDYDNNAVSGTLVVPAYKSIILYKTSGTIGDNPQYLVVP